MGINSDKQMTREDKCTAALHIMGSTDFWIVKAFQFTLGPISLLLLFFLAFIMFRHARLIHPNTRLIVINLGLAEAVCTLSYPLAGIVQINRYMTSNDPCRLLWTAADCVYMRAPSNLGVYTSVFSVAVLVVERVVATVRYRNYDANGYYALGYILTLISWYFGLIVTFYLSIDRVYTLGTDPQAFCQIYATDATYMSIVVTVLPILATEFVAVCVFFVVRKRNQKRWAKIEPQTITYSLRDNYSRQIAEIIRSTEMLLPVVVCHALFTIVNAVYIATTTDLSNDPMIAIQITTGRHEYLTLLPSLHNVIFFIICFKQPSMREAYAAFRNREFF